MVQGNRGILYSVMSYGLYIPTVYRPINRDEQRTLTVYITGHQAMVDVDMPGQHRGNILICAVIYETGVSTHIPIIGPYNSQQLQMFLHLPYSDLIPENERGLMRQNPPNVVIV